MATDPVFALTPAWLMVRSPHASPDILPLGAEEIARCTPIYETLPGWSESTVGVTEYDRLPMAARQYLERIEAISGVPVHLISTSPDRAHTIMRHHPFAAA